MASGKSIYLERLYLDAAFNTGTIALPATMYLGLSTAVWSATATAASFSEVVTSGATNYSRVEVARGALWSDVTASAGNPSQVTNNAVIEFPAGGTTTWGTIRSVYLLTSAVVGEGEWLYGGDLTVLRTLSAGDSVRFAAGQLIFREN